MKKSILPLAMLAFPLVFQAGENLNLAARMLLEEYKETHDPNAPDSQGGYKIRVLFCLADGYTVEDLDLRYLGLQAQVGNVVAATICLEDLACLESSPAVTLVELDGVAEADLAHATAGGQSGVEYAWQGHQGDGDAGIGSGFSGKGVVCGIYDKGLDPNHIAFRQRDDISRSRVKGVFNFTGGYGSYREVDPEGFTTDDTAETHGTHVLGIMAGGYNGPGSYCEWEFSDGMQKERCTNTGTYAYGTLRSYRDAESLPYSGVAYDADILVGCGGYYQGNMLAMAQLVRDYALEHGQPAVLNFSIGNQMGAKDGTSAFCRAIDEIGKDIIVCISASNTGAKKSTISRTFGEGSDSFRTLLVPKAVGTSVSESVELWSATPESFGVRIFVYDTAAGTRTEVAEINGPSSTLWLRADDLGEGFSGSLAVASGVQPQNGRYLLTIQGSGYRALTETRNVGIEVCGAPGLRVDVQGHPQSWRLESFGVEGFTKGSGEHSVNDFATAKNVFCVGSYSCRQIWGKLNSLYTQRSGGYGTSGLTTRDIETGDTLPVWPQRIHPTSSYACLADGRTLPTVAAPGSVVVSAFNRYYDFTRSNASAVATVDGEEYFWHYMSGTSQASPFFAGVCALWLEANPELKHDDIMEILANGGTRRDEYTEESPIRYGYGKVDAYGGLRYIMDHMSSVRVMEAGHPDVVVETGDSWVGAYGYGDALIRVELTDMAGVKAAASEAVGNVRIDTSALPKGVYVLTAASSSSCQSRKIMVR